MDEGTGASAELNSISRVPDGGAAFDTLLFVAQPPTPGTTNNPAASGYGFWASTHVESEAAHLDHDGDGLDNGTEYFMGSDPAAFTPNPSMVADSVTWPRAAGTTIGSFTVEVSNNLINWEDAAAGFAGNLEISASQVTFTPPSGAESFFVRLSVTP